MDKNPCEEVADQARNEAAHRLKVTRSNFAASIRQCQTAGLTRQEIMKIIGVDTVAYTDLLNFWGLDR